MCGNYIAIDWGSTHLRAWRYQQGECIDSRQMEAGITRLAGRHPRELFNIVTENWQAQQLPVVMAGMVGSNAGWRHAPYLPCPVALNEAGRRLTRVEDIAWIVPGISLSDSDHPNIMRGEETQLTGAWQLAPSSLYIMPGTHCKWAQVEEGYLRHFRTLMTGELHHLLLNHSLIGKGLPPQCTDQETFAEGVLRALDDPNILPLLFETRAAWILNKLEQDKVSEWLSGLLIGTEVAQMRSVYGPLEGHKITLVGGEHLSTRYQAALKLIGIRTEILDGDSAFQSGIRSIVNELVN